MYSFLDENNTRVTCLSQQPVPRRVGQMQRYCATAYVLHNREIHHSLQDGTAREICDATER